MTLTTLFIIAIVACILAVGVVNFVEDWQYQKEKRKQTGGRHGV